MVGFLVRASSWFCPTMLFLPLHAILSSLYNDTNPSLHEGLTLMTSSNPDHLPKAPPTSKYHHIGGASFNMNFREDTNIRSIATTT